MRLLGTLALGLALSCVPASIQAQSGSMQTTSAADPRIQDSSGIALSDRDSVLADSAPHKSRSDTVLVVKHSFNHRQQIIAGSVIMTCLMLMMVTMNNYNPR